MEKVIDRKILYSLSIYHHYLTFIHKHALFDLSTQKELRAGGRERGEGKVTDKEIVPFVLRLLSLSRPVCV